MKTSVDTDSCENHDSHRDGSQNWNLTEVQSEQHL